MLDGVITAEEFPIMKAHYEREIATLSKRADDFRAQRRNWAAALETYRGMSDAASEALAKHELTADIVGRLLSEQRAAGSAEILPSRVQPGHKHTKAVKTCQGVNKDQWRGYSVNSKRKGCAGEREFAALCRDHGYSEVQRGQQFQGGYDSPDVKSLPGIHVEVKRVEKLNVNDAMNQSIRDAEGKATPIVAHRRNRTPWLITMLAEDWFSLYKGGESK